MLAYDTLIIGCPTWNIGQLQEDWDVVYEQMDNLDFSGKKVAIFGLGDQYDYPDNFCDAIGILGQKFIERGAELVGYTRRLPFPVIKQLGRHSAALDGRRSAVGRLQDRSRYELND
jgi:flavodoxin